MTSPRPTEAVPHGGAPAPADDVPADLRLLPGASAGWVAAALSLAWPASWRLGCCALAAIGALVALARHRRTSRSTGASAAGASPAVGLCLAAVALCLGTSGLHDLARGAGSVGSLAEQGATVHLVATVASDPRLLPAATQRSGRDLVLVRLSVRSVEGRGQRSLVRSQVLVFADASWRSLHHGERLEAVGRLAPSRPGDDVLATLSARGPPTVTAAAPGAERIAERVRAALRAACVGLGPSARGLLPGLVVGDTSLQSAELGADLRATGLTHLSAVSGTNVTIVLVLALALARWAGFGRRLRLAVAAAALVGFVLLARPEPSVLRAAVMGAVGLIAVAGARRRAGVPALSASVLVLLVADPWLARSYGFALSVLATLGLLLLARPWTRSLSRRMPAPLAAGLAVPLAAQAACGPVVVLLSGQVSLVSLPANALVAAVVAPATVLGLAAALVGVVSVPLAHALAVVAGACCWWIGAVAHALASVPGGQLGWPGGAGGAGALAAVTVLTVLAGPAVVRYGRRHRWSAAAAVALVVAVVVPLPTASAWPPTGWLAVACDVGQGDAMVLRTGVGRAVLVDAGPSPADVDGCLRRLAVSTLDAVVLTHFHSDHVDGLPGALHGRTAGVVLTTIADDPPDQAAAVRRWADAARVPVRSTRAGEQGQVAGVRWQVLWPERVLDEGSVANNASVVLRVESAGVSLLLTGDIEPEAARVVARRMAQLPGGPRVDVLKVAHHGSAKQDPGLLTELHARLALISVGAGNDYGQPAPTTVRLLAGLGATLGRTDRQGDLAVTGGPAGVALATSGPRAHAPGTTHGSE